MARRHEDGVFASSQAVEKWPSLCGEENVLLGQLRVDVVEAVQHFDARQYGAARTATARVVHFQLALPLWIEQVIPRLRFLVRWHQVGVDSNSEDADSPRTVRAIGRYKLGNDIRQLGGLKGLEEAVLSELVLGVRARDDDVRDVILGLLLGKDFLAAVSTAL